jgi:hypothetical protein
MHIQIQTSPRRSGNVLLVTLLTCVIIGVTLASYLVLVSTQNQSVMRSLAWNSAIPVLEAGVEEAFAHLKYHEIGLLARNGWSTTDNRYFSKEIQIDDSFCLVTIDTAEPGSETPVIYSTAFVPAPLRPAVQSGMMQAQMGPSVDTSRFQGYLRRNVRVRTSRDYLFFKAMAADYDIDLNGKNVATDSFNSLDPNLSTNGKYDPAKKNDKGDVATNSGVIGSLDVGNASIMGSVSTGPGGSVDIGPNGSVGSKEWVDGDGEGIEDGYFTDDMNVPFPPIKDFPYTVNATSTTFTDTDGTQYAYHLQSQGVYQINSLTKGSVLVSQPNTILYVPDALSITGKDFIKIAPGASLKLYVGASTASIGGNGVVNADGSALAFQYLGMETNTKLSISGNGEFIGTIYAPSADMTLNGGGKSDDDFIGASVTKSVTMNGHYKFHYDEMLAEEGPFQGYIPISWDEI